MNARPCKQCGRTFQPKCQRQVYCGQDCFRTHRKSYIQKYMRSYRLQSGLALGSLNFNDLHIVSINGQMRVRSAIILEQYKHANTKSSIVEKQR